MAVKNANILIVEKDSKQTELIMDLIRDLGRVQVDTTNSGQRALELVSKTSYQVIIADCTSGDMEGLAVLERVKRVSPSTSVIVYSAFATIEESVRAMRMGAEEYFKKQFNPDQFKIAVQRCLDRRDLFAGDSSVTALMFLVNACQLISGYLEEEKIVETVLSYVRRETSAKAIALFKVTPSGSLAHVPTSVEADAEVMEVFVGGAASTILSSSGTPASGDERSSFKLIPRSSGAPELAVFPFRCTQASEYFAVAARPEWKTPPEEVAARFRLLQAQTIMTGRNIQNYRGVKTLLYLDEPTGLYNTRYMHVAIEREFEKRAKDPSHKFSILFIDVDKFKGINDSHGHLVGTKLLFEIAQILKNSILKGDIALRYGGDEFVLILPGASTARASEVAETFRQSVEKHSFLSKEGLNIKLTVSIGIANCPEHAQTKAEVIEAADNAMYSVKRSTRNSVTVADKKAA